MGEAVPRNALGRTRSTPVVTDRGAGGTVTPRDESRPALLHVVRNYTPLLNLQPVEAGVAHSLTISFHALSAVRNQ
jgi:hypothetical protein